jgi:hypothetical protein
VLTVIRLRTSSGRAAANCNPHVTTPRAAQPVDGTRGQLVLNLRDDRDGSLHTAVDELVHHAVEISAGPEGPPVDQHQGTFLAKVVHHAAPAPRIGKHAVPQDGHVGRPRNDPGGEPTELRFDAHHFTVPTVQ